jgi:hypothetical protein
LFCDDNWNTVTTLKELHFCLRRHFSFLFWSFHVTIWLVHQNLIRIHPAAEQSTDGLISSSFGHKGLNN